ncbi:MAG TPA: DUF1992 domain-containing protein [Bryobacteraceae bacterium]|nr:DUF1992 domain-containing protein [Bryobacteraceae bacterium]
MDEWRSIAERKIREAMEEGAFDDLAGKGRPLDLEEDPYEDPSLRMAHRLLRNNGFAPAWIEEAKDLELTIETLRRDIARGIAGRFRERIEEINRRILSHNLKTPSTRFHLSALDPDKLLPPA